MLRSAARKVMWVGRATVFLVGLCVILAMLFGVSTAALGATGENLILGKLNNTAETPTGLVSTLTDATKSALVVINKSGGSALDLRVGNASVPANSVAPMRVNSNKRVPNLNADRLDNLNSTALMRASTYEVDSPVTDNSTTLPNTIVFVKCDLGDKILSGGYSGLEPDEGDVTIDRPLVTSDSQGQKEAWQVSWKNGATSESGVTVIAWCADFPPAHRP